MKNFVILALLFCMSGAFSQSAKVEILLGTEKVHNVCKPDAAGVKVKFKDASVKESGGLNFNDWILKVKYESNPAVSHDLDPDADDVVNELELTYTEVGQYSIEYTVTDQASDEYKFIDTFYVHAKPTVAFDYKTDSISSYRIYYDTTGTVLSKGTKDAYSFQWDFAGDGTLTDTTGRVAWKYTEQGTNADSTYSVKLKVVLKDDATCAVESAVQNVKVLDVLSDLDQVIAPNVFTPNGDNVNDYWIVKSNGDSDLKVQIFNRNGNLVYKTTAKTITWDGNTEKGLECAPGIYYYILKDEEGKEEARKGFFYLLRE